MSDEQNRHIFDLYHALNLALPGYMAEDGFDLKRENWKEVPPSPTSVEEAKVLFRAHHKCCGKIYNDFFLEAVATIQAKRDAT